MINDPMMTGQVDWQVVRKSWPLVLGRSVFGVQCSVIFPAPGRNFGVEL
jgi:hypothetical protein